MVKNKANMKHNLLTSDHQELALNLPKKNLTEPLFAAQQLVTEQSTGQQPNTFQTNIAINPIVAAASPLFTLSTQLAGQTTSPDLKELHHTLSHEIKLFENKANALGYRAPIILAARYLLCALLDEIILTTDWGKKSQWLEHNLLQTFQREAPGGERFFLILERSCENPELHIDLLELGYLCLSLGFQGKYRGTERSHQELGQIIDNIYHFIRYVRGDFSKCLLISPQTASHAQTKQKPKKKVLRFPPVWVAIISSMIALGSIYLPYRIHLNKLSAPVNEMIEQINQSTGAATSIKDT